MEGCSPGPFGPTQFPFPAHRDPDISNDLSMSYVGTQYDDFDEGWWLISLLYSSESSVAKNQLGQSDSCRMEMSNKDSVLYASNITSLLSPQRADDDVRNPCVTWVPRKSARRDAAR